MRDKIWMYSEKQMKKYHFKNCDYVRYMGSPISKREWYDDVVYFDFEGYKMPVPIGYDIILRREYGDYMQYPPVDKRKPITKVVFYKSGTNRYGDIVFECINETAHLK
jgi:lipopolysaccharide cholinephosphotransferase